MSSIHRVPLDGGSDDQVAAEVPFMPSLGMVADDVQEAIEELKQDQGGSASKTKHAFTDKGTFAIAHNTGIEKMVQVFDSTGNEIEASVMQDANTITITVTPQESGYVLYF